jgi:DNA-binding transcriptional ArsR family regulator
MSLNEVCEMVCLHEEAVRDVQSRMLTDETVLKGAEIFKLLGDPTRVKLLCARSHRELCVCDLSAVLGMTQSAVSHQLRVLRDAHLVKFKKEGKVVFYSLADAHVSRLLDMGVEHAEER